MNAILSSKVSILMNCHNGEKYLRQSLDSLLQQTYKNWEIIFWDNQSTDKSASIFKSYNDNRFKYYLAENYTDLGKARDLASRYLDGEYIAFLDVDDLWLPKKIEIQIKKFLDKDVGVVISNTDYFNDFKSRTLYPPGYQIKSDAEKMLLKKYNISLETVMIRRSLFGDKIFNSRYSYIADFELIMRSLENSKLAYCDQVLAKWRIHDHNCSWLFPKKFNQEKKKWVQEKKLSEKYLNRYGDGLDYFENRLNCSRLINYSYKNKKKIKIRIIKILKFNFVISWLVLFTIFNPFRDKIISHQFNKYFLNDVD